MMVPRPRSGAEAMRRLGLLRTLGLSAVLGAIAATAAATDDEDATTPLRAGMVMVIEAHAAAYSSFGEISAPVIAAMGRVPRHRFVPERLRAAAYDDRPLPIGYGQTISQPYIVALMSDLLAVQPGDSVLEVGTGSGYQAAILDALGVHTYTIEIVPELGRAAAERLDLLGYTEVETRTGDGYYGWPDGGPFDAIVVTAAGSHVPPPLMRQLKPGGRMVIPVGDPFTIQHLMLVTKNEDGSIPTRQLLPVRFVPLTGGR